MRARAALLVLLAASMSAPLAQPAPRLEPGVSQELARWRARHYSGLRYALELRLDARKSHAAGLDGARLPRSRDSRVELLQFFATADR